MLWLRYPILQRKFKKSSPPLRTSLFKQIFWRLTPALRRRAGEAGKGFAVVADEIRTLANKSDKAAKQTKTLIEDSISAVSRGTQIVKEVGDELGVSTDIVLQAVEDMKSVSIAVHDENNEIVHISESINQIDAVVQQNTAAGEENAGVAQTLLTQSKELKRIMKQIKLKDMPKESV